MLLLVARTSNLAILIVSFSLPLSFSLPRFLPFHHTLWDIVSLYTSEWPEVYYMGKADLELPESHLFMSLSLECCN